MPLVSSGSGVSTNKDSYQAGSEAALKAKRQLNSDKADILIVFAGYHFTHADLLSGIQSVFPDSPMVGGTTAGEISPQGFSTHSVVIMALKSDRLTFVTEISHEMSADEKKCATVLAKKLLRNHSLDDALSMIVFPDGMGGDGVKVIEGLNDALKNSIEIVGGYCGDGENFQQSFQFYNGNVYKDSIIGLLIKGDKEIFRTGIGVGSGFESIGNRMYCTEASGNVIKKIDNQPALDIYTEMLGEKRAKKLPGVCLEYPFGLIDEEVSIQTGDKEQKYFQLRCGLTVDYRRKTITLAGSVPQGSSLTLTTGSREDILSGAAGAAQLAISFLDDFTPELIIMFSCVGRKLVLGRRVEEETRITKKILGKEVPCIGFYTYGEIGPVNTMENNNTAAKFHNETLVVWTLGSRNKTKDK